MMEDDWISASEARARLGVRAQTLYAYVSRGLLQVRSHPSDSRRSLYRADQVDDIAKHNKRSRKRADIASTAIAWGEPVITSGITTVQDGRFYYRGKDAVGLSEDQPLEAVAALLRGTAGNTGKTVGRCKPPALGDLRPRLFTALAERAAVSAPMLGSGPADLEAEASALIEMVADTVCGALLPGRIDQRLALAWGADPDGPVADLIRRMLVLVADHELNASTFAARVTASTGASLAAAVLSGLAALSGPRHGGMSAIVRRFAAEASLHGARDAVQARLIEGRHVPGFGHRLYPRGDIRAHALLGRFEAPPALGALQTAARELAGIEPNIDFAMLASCMACGLPDDAPFAIFATARCAGWIAHALEQHAEGKLVRPRARYVGPEPER